MSLGNMDVSLKLATPPPRRDSSAFMENLAPMCTPNEPSPACSPTPPNLMDDNHSLSPTLPSPPREELSTPPAFPEAIEQRSSSREILSPNNDLAFGSQQDVSGEKTV